MENHHAYSESVHSQYDWSDTAPSAAVIDAIASLENVEPVTLSTELDSTLYDCVDPEALDALVTDGSPVAISFTIADYEVRIDGSNLLIHYD